MPTDSEGDDQKTGDDPWSTLLAGHARLHRQLFFRLAYGVLRDPVASEDACQAALMKAWVQRSSIADPLIVKRWICRVVVTESLAIARRRRLEERVFPPPVQGGGLAPAGTVEAISPAAKKPVEDEELRAAVLAALEQLPETTRLIVVLRDMHGETGVAVAELLGLSGSDVSRELHEGRRQLRGLMSGFADQSGPNA